ncbi:hypothetical protein EDB89DRAFT_2138048 [Lactarius sanguifluus]|nr:hypothetical protein EDB89DRAFT_2138048 [Lactarius sanguifluus]
MTNRMVFRALIAGRTVIVLLLVVCALAAPLPNDNLKYSSGSCNLRRGTNQQGREHLMGETTESLPDCQEARTHAVIEGEGAEPAQNRLWFLRLDLASLRATKVATEEFSRRNERLDVMMLKGCTSQYDDYVVAVDGLEQTVEVKCYSPLLKTTASHPGSDKPVGNVVIRTFAPSDFLVGPTQRTVCVPRSTPERTRALARALHQSSSFGAWLQRPLRHQAAPSPGARLLPRGRNRRIWPFIHRDNGPGRTPQDANGDRLMGYKGEHPRPNHAPEETALRRFWWPRKTHSRRGALQKGSSPDVRDEAQQRPTLFRDEAPTNGKKLGIKLAQLVVRQDSTLAATGVPPNGTNGRIFGAV